MLLGIAQVVVNLPELDPAVEALRAAGYQQSFAQRGIPNNPAKCDLQGTQRESLDMVHFAAPDGGVAVELTAYAGTPPTGSAAFELQLPVPRSDGSGLESVADRLGPAGSVVRVAVPTADPERSYRFWRETLGFCEAEGGGLTFPAIRTEWTVALDLRQGTHEGPTTVDAEGCVLITMLTTSLETELDRLSDDMLVTRVTSPWDESIDRRTVRVAMAGGPGGELIELLEPTRSAQGASIRGVTR